MDLEKVILSEVTQIHRMFSLMGISTWNIHRNKNVNGQRDGGV